MSPHEFMIKLEEKHCTTKPHIFISRHRTFSIWISGLPRCEFWLLTEVPLRKQTRQSWPSMSSAISTLPSSAHVTMTRRSWRCRNSVSHSSRFQHRIRTRRWVHMPLQRRHISVMPNLQIDYLCNNLFGKLIIKKMYKFHIANALRQESTS